MNVSVALPPASSAGEVLPCAPTVVVANDLERLYSALYEVTSAENPRTARLMSGGLRRISQKVVEEAAEVALEAVRKRTDTTISESADLLYHLVILWHALGIQPADVWAEMRQRVLITGIAEKRPKPRGRKTAHRSSTYMSHDECPEGRLVSDGPIITHSRAPAAIPQMRPKRTRPCGS